jgi:hypothetical protein
MFFWFIGTVVVTVWFVFRDLTFDYRLLMVGSVLPAAVDAFFGGARVLHSVTFSIVLLAVLMLATPGRKPIRRTLLALPVGTLLHLVFTGAWTNTTVFWWPVAGFGFDDAPHPVAERGWWNVPLELIGLALCWWVVKEAQLRRYERRAWFRHTGQLVLPTR